MSTLPRKIGMDVMTKDDRYTRVGQFVNRISKYASVYHVIVIIILFLSQLDIFNENVPIWFVVDLVIGMSIFIVSTNILDKVLRKNRQDSKPFLYCPECDNAKMRTAGKWICEECGKDFGKPRVTDDS